MTPARRFALLYAAQFAALGAAMPFVPAALEGGGLSPAQVGLLLAAGTLARLLAGPASAPLADRCGLSPVLMAAAAAAAVTLPGLGLFEGLLLLLALQLLHNAALAPILPLSDAAAVAEMRRRPFDYGRVRAAGSIAFILGAVVAGWAAAQAGPVAALSCAALCLLAVVPLAHGLPQGPSAAGARPGRWWEPLREPAFRRLLPVSALIQGSHAVYYGFSTLHWTAAGLSPLLVGALWASGVLAEVLLFLFGRPLVERLGSRGLALVAGAGGLLRWSVLAATTDPWLLWAAQALHAASFGAMHLAAIRALASLPEGLGARAQTLHAALGVGLASSLLMLAAGPLYAAFGGGAFLAMAGLCALGLAAALRMPP
ncbi:MAG: MFS transporter [Rhodovarius sp.]|nr:MFS transporter [Rhodovarius sp.]